MDDKQAQKQRNDENNANNIKNAADVAIASKNPYAMAAGAAVKAADKISGGKASAALGKGLTKANQMVPGGKQLQKASNKLSESGASDKIGAAARMKSGGGKGAAGAAGGASNAASKASDLQKLEKNVGKVADTQKKKDEEEKKKKADKNLFKPKNKIKIICIGAALGFLIVLLLFVVITSPGGSILGGANFNELSEYEMAEEKGEEVDDSDSDTEKAESEWHDAYEDFTSEENEKFYKRFNTAYWWLKFANPFIDANKIEKSKQHVLATLFLDYSPEVFTENTDKSFAENDNGGAPFNEDDNVYDDTGGYTICGEIDEEEVYTSNDLCDQGSTSDSDYEEVDESKSTKYINDADTIRKLTRQLIMFRDECVITSSVKCDYGEEGCNCNNTSTTPPSDCTKEQTSIVMLGNHFTFWEFLKALYTNAGTVFNAVETSTQQCEAYKTQPGVSSASYSLKKDVDLCAYYEFLAESDYFDSHKHFEENFDELMAYTDPSVLESKKLKVRLALIHDIIETVDLADESEPIMKRDSAANVQTEGVYTLSSGVNITVEPNPDKGTSGGTYPLDQYVEGVLAAEVGVFVSWSKNPTYTKYGVTTETTIETFKAMAVAIRSFVLASTQNGKYSIVNSSARQNFSSSLLNSNTERALMYRNAAQSTSGIVIMNGSKILTAQYDAFCTTTSTKANGNGGFSCNDEYCTSRYYKNGGTSIQLHDVTIPKTWSRAGGHCNGMSQMAAFYLAGKGYTYLDLLRNFYNSETAIVQYDFGTGEATVLETNGYEYQEAQSNEAMLVCNFLDPDYTIEIPLRTTGLSELYANNVTPPISPGNLGPFSATDPVANAIKFINQDYKYMHQFFDTYYPDTGERRAWCARFVSYIFKNTANSGMTFGGSSSVSGWTDYVRENSQYYHSNYWANSTNNSNHYSKFASIETKGNPQRGDIIFFVRTGCDNGYDGYNVPSPDVCSRHIGIVESFDGSIVTYVHGNTSTDEGVNGVNRGQVDINDPYIIGYGIYNR